MYVIWLDDVRVSLFLLWCFFSHLIHMYNVIQIECCLEYLRFVHFMFDCGVKFVHATSTHGPFKRCDEEQKKEKNINELLSNLSGYFRVIRTIDWNDDVIGYLKK